MFQFLVLVGFPLWCFKIEDKNDLVLVGLLVSGFQIRGPRGDIAKRVIRVFLFGI